MIPFASPPAPVRSRFHIPAFARRLPGSSPSVATAAGAAGAAVLILLGWLLASPLPAQARAEARAEQEPSFRSEEQVTAVDLAIALDPPRTFRPSTKPPSATSVRVEVDGRSLPVVALDPAPANRGDAPWTILLYFDLALSDRSQTSWAAELLSHRLADLTRLGTIELVVADPEPRTVVSATRDTHLLEETLSHMVFFPEAEDALVESRLASGLSEAEADGPSTEPAAPPPGAHEAVQGASTAPTALERALIVDRLDRLLLTAIDRTANAESRRVIFLASGGFESDGGDGPVHRATDRTAATLAAYGWTVVPLLEHPPSGTVPGFRIGKWRFHKPDKPFFLTAVFLAATREQERDPEMAAAYLALAKSRQAQGELEGAARAARQAMTHFADDPRTAKQQGEALLVLAEVYEAQGRTQLARRTYLRAATRDPDALADNPQVLAAVRRPEVVVHQLARATLGSVVRTEQDWEPALATLDRRGLVTVQLAGLPDGELHAARVTRIGQNSAVDAVASLRFGTPREVVAARARSLLDDVPAAGTLPVSATIRRPEPRSDEEPEPSATRPSLSLRADPSTLAPPPRAAVLRATLAVPGDEGETRVIELAPDPLDPAPTTPWSWTLDRSLQTDEPVEWGVVVVDDLVSGAWGAALAQAASDAP